MKPFVLVVALLGASAGSACAQSTVDIYGVQGAAISGRQYNPDYLAPTDAGHLFTGGMAVTTGNLFNDFVRNSGSQFDNSINAHGAEMSGVPAGALYGAGEVARARDPKASRAWGLSVGFALGRLAIRLAHQNRNVAGVAPATPMGNNMDAKNSLLAANLRVGDATAYAAYSVNRGWGSSPLFNPDNPYGASMASSPSLDSRDVLVGLALPCGPATLLASYIRKNDRDLSNRDANQVALGASYTVSRRTDVYASYSRITDRSSSGAGDGLGNGNGNVSVRGAGSSALNLGLRHGF